jgi:hypothetical protein
MHCPERTDLKFERRLVNKRTNRIRQKYGLALIEEIRLRCNSSEDDYQTVLKAAQDLLNRGFNIKVLTMLRGREMQYSKSAMERMKQFAEALQDSSLIQREPRLEGKSLIMILSSKAPPPSEADLLDDDGPTDDPTGPSRPSGPSGPDDQAPIPRRPLPIKDAGEVALPEPAPEKDT